MGLKKLKKWAVWCAVAVLLAALGIIGVPFVLTEVAVRKVLESPTVILTDPELTRLFRYIQSDCWWQLPGSLISEERQAALVEAAIRRAESGIVCDEHGHTMYNPELLLPISMQRRLRGTFPTLPRAVNDALRRHAKHADGILTCAMGDPGSLAPYIDPEFLLTSSDNGVLVSGILALDMWTLNKHRGLCFEIFRRDDVWLSCKGLLLELVAAENEGAEWFAGREELLQELRQLDDEKINEHIEEILRQICGETQPAEEAEAKP